MLFDVAIDRILICLLAQPGANNKVPLASSIAVLVEHRHETPSLPPPLREPGDLAWALTLR